MRFRREVDVAARLSHPNIVSVLDADEDRGVQFMTMEYIEGNDLDRLVRDGGVLPVDQALDCVIQAARGLEAAHAQGIVHRDIKPGNLMLDGSGLVRVLDLGLARLVEASNPFGETASGPLTQSGTYMGTVDFMAPEQGIDSRRVDHRADIYSLGCTLCYLLTGRAPFEGATVLARLMAHQDRAPSSLLAARPDVPRGHRRRLSEDDGQEARRPPGIDERGRRTAGGVPVRRAHRRTSTVGPEAFAATVIMKRASPRVTVRESVFGRDEPAGCAARARTWFSTTRDQGRPAVPVARAVVEEPAPVREADRVGPASQDGESQVACLAIGALALAGTRGPGLFAVAARRRQAAGQMRGAAARSGRLTGRQAALGKLADQVAVLGHAPRSSSTFDVATLYSIHGTDDFARERRDHRRHRRRPARADRELDRVRAMIDVDAGRNAGPALGPHDGWQGARPTVAMTPDGRRGLIGTGKVRKDNFKRVKVETSRGILWFWDLTTGERTLSEATAVSTAPSPPSRSRPTACAVCRRARTGS